jgi:hypothetical protein
MEFFLLKKVLHTLVSSVMVGNQFYDCQEQVLWKASPSYVLFLDLIIHVYDFAEIMRLSTE